MNTIRNAKWKLLAPALLAVGATSARADEIADLITAANSTVTAFKGIGAAALALVIFAIVIKLMKRGKGAV